MQEIKNGIDRTHLNWYTDEVELHYEDDNGNVYHRSYPNLAGLFAAPDIVLEPAANE